MPFNERPQPLKLAAISSFLLFSSLVTHSSEAQAVTGSEALPVLSAPIVPIQPIPAQPILVQPLPAQPIPVQPILVQPIPAQPIPVQSAPALPSAATPESAYTLGAGDAVRVDIFRVPQYSGESQVLVDGTLNLPLIGKVNVDGLSIEAASEAISRRYGQYLKRPLITLSLISRRSLQVGIAGEITRPGSYTIDQNNTDSARLSRVIEQSGGITQSADLSQVQIRRTQRDGSQQVLAANLWELIQNGNLSQDVTLRDGDSIFIPTASVPLDNAALLADSSFAADVGKPINIAIIGEVYRPGPYTLQGGVARTGNAGTPGSGGSSNSPTTVTRAIQVAGGIKPKADIRKVQVIRPTRAGTPQIFDVDLWQLLQVGDLKQDAVLQEGDSIFIPTAADLSTQEIGELAAASFSPNTIRVNVVGEVKQAGVVELPPNTPLSQAVLAAGGFNNRAAQGSAELVRLNENGTVERSSIPVNFAEGIDEQNNPLLQNNDVVIVNRNGLAAVSDTIGTVLNPLGGLFSIFRFFNIFD